MVGEGRGVVEREGEIFGEKGRERWLGKVEVWWRGRDGGER